MAVTSFDRRIGRLARAHALHPVAHIGRGLRISVRIGVGVHRGGLVAERHARQQVGLHVHLVSEPFRQPACGRHRLLVHVDHAAIRVVELLHSARRICKA